MLAAHAREPARLREAERRCSAIEASLPVSAMTAMTWPRPEASAQAARSAPSSARPSPRPACAGETYTVSSTVYRYAGLGRHGLA